MSKSQYDLFSIRFVSLKLVWMCSLLFLSSCGQAELEAAETVSASDHEFEMKVFHFPLISTSPERANLLVESAREEGFNAVQVIVREGVALDSAPWTPQDSAWSKSDLANWIAFTKGLGFQIIPEIKLLTHQEKFFESNYPDLLFNKVTYDPRLDRTYDVVFGFLDEIIRIFDPHAIHIGHDEVKSPKRNKRRLNPGDKLVPADLYLMDVVKIRDYLRSQGIDTWMWGDMLVSASEFPDMLAKHLHAKDDGYGKELRRRIPKDIVICDWHYHDQQTGFPTLSTFSRKDSG